METINKRLSRHRDEDGLLIGVEYHFDENGLVDWRKMLKPEFLVPNKERFEKRNQTPPTSIEGVDDADLLILLPGIKYLAQLRGFDSVRYESIGSSPHHCAVVCSIGWIENYETESRPILFSAIGDASLENTDSFARLYLGPIAENRAFVRCVRSFLRINIVGNDEVVKSAALNSIGNSDSKPNPHAPLKARLTELNVTFADLQKKLVASGDEQAASWNDITDIPATKVFTILGNLKNVKKGKTK